jgi:thiosulfate dehydrogenase (quinone)
MAVDHAVLLPDGNKHSVAHWDAATLSGLPKSAFPNNHAYNKFGSGAFGIVARMGAAATLTLPVPVSGATTSARNVQLADVDGKTFSAPLSGKT